MYEKPRRPFIAVVLWGYTKIVVYSGTVIYHKISINQASSRQVNRVIIVMYNRYINSKAKSKVNWLDTLLELHSNMWYIYS